MHPALALERLGGVAHTSTLLTWTTRGQLAGAVRRGEITRMSRGRYALPGVEAAKGAAMRLSGVVSHDSAALLHGWEVARDPHRPAVVVPRSRRMRVTAKGVDVRRRDLEPHEIDGIKTSAHRTVIDCAKDLPFAQALSIADSALRHDAVCPDHLRTLAGRVSTNGRRSAQRVVAEMSGLAANPFESALRAIALDVLGLRVAPQVEIADDDVYIRPDLVDVERRIVLEGESYEFHGGRRALKRDCARYNTLTLMGWTVLRFAWEHVMLDPDYVRSALMAVVGHATPRREWAQTA